MNRQVRVVLASEALVAAPVEGAQVLANEIAEHLRLVHAAVALGPQHDAQDDCLPLLHGRWPGRQALQALRRACPERLVYIPAHGLTTAALARAATMWVAAGRPDFDLVILQTHGRAIELAARHAPLSWRFVATTNAQIKILERAGRRPGLLQPRIPATKTSAFSTKDQARAALGLPDGPLFLHVGHPRRSRNLRALDALAASGQLVLVMSPYGQEDGEALPTGSNVTVIRERRDDLCDIYKAASVYVFPTFNDEGVIGTPLSIFEALANGTPVVARRSAATARWADLPGLTLVDSDIELVEAAQHHHERVASLASINAHTCTGDLAVCQ